MDIINHELPVYRLAVSENDLDGVNANSLVNDPANGFGFVAFSKDPQPIKFAKDAVKRIVTGVLIQPDQLIYRRDDRIGEHYVFFSTEDVDRIAKKMAKNKQFSSVNLEHAAQADGVHMLEVWRTGRIDKSQDMGFSVRPNTLMGSYFIESDAVWKSVEDGTFKGFSVEGMFTKERVEMNAQPPAINTPAEFWSFLQDDQITEEKKLEEIDRVISSPQK